MPDHEHRSGRATPKMRERLAHLKKEHRELDAKVEALSADPRADQLQLRRLKSRKLRLKDEITALENKLIPDLDA